MFLLDFEILNASSALSLSFNKWKFLENCVKST